MEKKTDKKALIEYLNIVGAAAFFAFTLVQAVYAVIWMANNVITVETGKKVFCYKELAGFVFLGVIVYFLIFNVVRKVMCKNIKPFYFAVMTAYIISLPITVSAVFNATLYAICISFLLLLLLFSLRYFYGKHERRLYLLIGIFAILVVLSYLNRGAFWCGVIETFAFLTIQLVRNIGIRRKNIGDKSWRNTLLLFCILVIIMLMPQYFTYNHINHTLYHQSFEEQAASRIIVPYLEYEKFNTNEKYLLGVVRNSDYNLGHSYNNFRKIIHRYEEDNLDMDSIWNNLYRNVYYRYGKSVAKRYLRDTIRGFFSPYTMDYEMKSDTVITHYGYYYTRFEKNCPIISNVYMRLGTKGLFAISVLSGIQILVTLVIYVIKGKYKIKLEEGRHTRTEAVILLICFGFFWTAVQTFFSIEGTSFVAAFGAVLMWILASTLVWFNKSEI